MKRKPYRKRPDGEVRRSKLVISTGPGAVVDLPDHAVVLKGLDAWKYTSETDGFLHEARLERQVFAVLKAAGSWPHSRVRLRLPPRSDDDHDKRGPWQGIHATRFPSWSLCRSCRSLVRHDKPDDKHVCTDDGRTTGRLVPVRFVAGCRAGHLQDIFWRSFIHRGSFDEAAPKPYMCVEDPAVGGMTNDKGDRYTSDIVLFTTGASGELSDQAVRCRRCGKQRSLQDLRQPNALGKCRAWRPWLTTNDAACTEDLKLLIRTGSNVWFPRRESVLSIPDKGAGLHNLVSKHWDQLERVETANELHLMLSLVATLEEAFSSFKQSEVLRAIKAKRAGLDKVVAPIRQAEWAALMVNEWDDPSDLPPRGETWWPRRLDAPLPEFLHSVVLVHALREVRALVGFTRIESTPTGPEGEAAGEGGLLAPMSEHADWVPAAELLGEGIFLAFNEDDIREWEARPAVQAREQAFREGMYADNKDQGDSFSPEAFTSARLLMLHSLAHMLITQISLEAGYSASAIRERIYCHRDPDDPAKSRAGILLYTGTPGSEGTLGGLVEVGRDIVRHLRLAVKRARICSNDPICAQHVPNGLEDGRRREGAACHGCLLIAEPSCERMNRDLDRAMVVPTLENRDAAFLRDWVEKGA